MNGVVLRGPACHWCSGPLAQRCSHSFRHRGCAAKLLRHDNCLTTATCLALPRKDRKDRKNRFI